MSKSEVGASLEKLEDLGTTFLHDSNDWADSRFRQVWAPVCHSPHHRSQTLLHTADKTDSEQVCNMPGGDRAYQRNKA